MAYHQSIAYLDNQLRKARRAAAADTLLPFVEPNSLPAHRNMVSVEAGSTGKSPYGSIE